MCATIPFAALRDVQLDKRTKLGLFAILGCGLITAACSIGRVSALDFSNPDPTCTCLLPFIDVLVIT